MKRKNLNNIKSVVGKAVVVHNRSGDFRLNIRGTLVESELDSGTQYMVESTDGEGRKNLAISFKMRSVETAFVYENKLHPNDGKFYIYLK